MGLWKDSNSGVGSQSSAPGAAPSLREANVASLASADAARRTGREPAPAQRSESRESYFGADITIEGKITGAGDVRIAGRFKGGVQVEGSFTLDAGARVEGDVKAAVIVVGGELIGNIDGARRVDLLETGTIHGDVRAAAVSVAAGAKMRGRVEFGLETENRTPLEVKGFGNA